MTLCCPRCGEAVPDHASPPSLRCSAEAYDQVGKSLARHRQERFVVIALDARNRIIRRHVVAVGSLSSVTVHPREVFAPLVRGRAAACIVVHNHPSSVADPSPEDLSITRRLVEGGRLLGIPVLDHLVVGREGFFSMRDHGLMDSNAGGDEARVGCS